MTITNQFDVIIIGGSYAGLSAAMALGRSLRKTLIIDSGKPCNVSTPHSHNFITHDGKTPSEISTLAKQQVLKYPTITFYNGLAIQGKRLQGGFEISTQSGDTFSASKLVFTTGVRDIMPDIKGFAECWGKTVIHCPYCHGYEVKHEVTGILANGDIAFEFTKLISNWTNTLTLYTNGKSTLSEEQTHRLRNHRINVVEKEIVELEQDNGQIRSIVFKDGSRAPLKALYAKIPFVQHCEIPAQLGCELTEHGHLKIDMFQKTSVPGVYASGDSTTMMRAVSAAVAAGGMAGAMLNKEMVDESF